MISATHIRRALNLSACALIKYTKIILHHLRFDLNLLCVSLKSSLLIITQFADALVGVAGMPGEV